jgi:hypothetical protein
MLADREIPCFSDARRIDQSHSTSSTYSEFTLIIEYGVLVSTTIPDSIFR